MSENASFQKHPMAIAIDEWLESEEGRKCLAEGAHGVYLRNRLMSAFRAGWDAHEQHVTPAKRK